MILYTDIDQFCCQWLENLVKAGLLPMGDVLCADMTEINPESVRKYTQRHWCCGIGGWPYALQLAGWPLDRPIDSVSLPCQPFSVAGKQKGEADERHIWPAFREIVAVLRPATLIGEQVEAAIRLGWLDGIFDDLEGRGYACGAVVLPACSVGAPHIRQRLWWVADSQCAGFPNGLRSQGTRIRDAVERCQDNDPWQNSTPIPCADGKWRRVPGGVEYTESGPQLSPGQGRTVRGENSRENAGRGCDNGKWGNEFQPEIEPSVQLVVDGLSAFLGDAWDESLAENQDAIRRLQKGAAKVTEGMTTMFPLCGTIPGRVGLLKGAGNSIVAQLAAEFVRVFMDSITTS